MSKSIHDSLKYASLVLAVLLLGVGIPGVAAPKKEGGTFHIIMAGDVDSGGEEFEVVGDKRGHSFSQAENTVVELLLGGSFIDLIEHPLYFSGVDVLLDPFYSTYGNSGFTGGQLGLFFNTEFLDEEAGRRDVFRLQVFLDAGGKRGPGCYSDGNARIDMWHVAFEEQWRGKRQRWRFVHSDSLVAHMQGGPEQEYVTGSVTVYMYEVNSHDGCIQP